MSLQIKNTLDSKKEPVNTIVYGKSGVGKTSLVKTLPVKECLFLSAESGLLSVKDAGVDYIDVKNVKDILKLLGDISASKYQTVIIDSITELSQNEYTFLKAKYDKLAIADEKKAGAYNMQIWGEFLEDFSAMFKTLRDMKKNVIGIALLKEKEAADGTVTYGPDIYGKTADRIVAWFDECFYMHVTEEGERSFLTEQAKGYSAKDRSTKLEKIEPAHMGKIHAKINAVN